MNAQAMLLPSSSAQPARRSAAALLGRVREELVRTLIARAWRRTLVGGAATRPWPWADVYPVARLEAPEHALAVTVLAGDGARALRFGPGHIEGTPLPGDPGNALISGRRDAHFGFVRALRSGHALQVHAASGRLVRYVVSGIEVVRRNDVRLLLDTGDDRLTLVTAYPFDCAVPGALRYVVVAVRSDTAVTRA